MALKKAERNDLMEGLLRGGLKSADCTLRDGAPVLSGVRLPSYEIAHTPTQSGLTLIGPDPRQELAPRIPSTWHGDSWSGDEPPIAWTAETWGRVLAYVERWAKETVEWERTPDLWALDAATLPDAADNSPFTQPERDEIAKRLDEITQLVREKFELPDDQLAAIGQAVEGLKEASERIGRKDWKLMFYGAFVTLGLEHAVQSSVVQTMLQIAVHGLGHIFGSGGQPMITA